MELMFEAIELINKIYTDIPLSARVAYIGWSIYVAIYFFLRRFEKHNNLLKKRKLKISNKPYTMYVLVIFSLLLTVYFSSQSLTFELPAMPGVAWEFSGFTMMLIGLAIAMDARAHLNGFWGGGIFEYDENEEQRLVQKGMYRLIRHPIYFGQLLMTAGTVLLVNNYILVFLPLLTLISNISRALKEEKDLSERFGDEFLDYKNKSEFLIPTLW